jgi:hypothetical protein
MKTIQRIINGGSGNNVAIAGKFIWNKLSSDNIHIETNMGETAVLSSGEYVRFENGFSSFYLSDTSGSQNNTTLAIGNGDSGKYGGDVNITQPTKLLDVDDVTVTSNVASLILPANSSRSEVIITSLDSNTNTTRIGSSSVSQTRGSPLPVGGVLVLKTGGAIYAHNTSAETFSVSYTEF